jgi:hypothetical protein
MNTNYSDITEKLGDPVWYDENAVPRYCEFHPRKLADIYAKECVLILIACQNCGREFKVAVSYDFMNVLREEMSLQELISNNTIGYIEYGDPPNNDCCPSGITMSSNTIALLQFWKQRDDFGWEQII